MESLGDDPFTYALALAWADDRLTATEFHQLDALQDALGLSNSERAVYEQAYENSLENGTATKGDDPASLVEWIDAIRALASADEETSTNLARSLGATALRAGITREGWAKASAWMGHLGLGAPFAEGCWMEGGVASPLQAVPLALAPAAGMLGLLDS
ncbi:MAG: hypothetical protein VX627_02420 [Candidatus Thermoplasmatota archaeon]|nr:hypothetical protein [Candidatus Thermoplasmatota archaeon]